MRIIFFVIMTLTANISMAASESKSYSLKECGHIQMGGELRVFEESIVLHIKESGDTFFINKDDTLEIKGPTDLWGLTSNLEEKIHYIYNLTGQPAARMYLKLLEYYRNNNPKSCRFLDYRGGVLFAKGVTCMWSQDPRSPSDFRCTFVAYGKEQRYTSSLFVALPRPRMGAGNATALYEMLSVYLDHRAVEIEYERLRTHN